MSNDIDKFIGKLVRVAEGKTWKTEAEKHKQKIDARNKKRKKSAEERKSKGSGGGVGGGRWHKDPKTGRRTFKAM